MVLPCRSSILGVVFAGLLIPSRGLARRGENSNSSRRSRYLLNYYQTHELPSYNLNKAPTFSGHLVNEKQRWCMPGLYQDCIVCTISLKVYLQSIFCILNHVYIYFPSATSIFTLDLTVRLRVLPFTLPLPIFVEGV